MRIDTPVVASKLLQDPSLYITPIGSLLRKLSLDEIPQLWSILKGDMSFVGPRPVILSEKGLIELRTQNNVHMLKPGLTGWAQVNGRDSLSAEEKTKLDVEYLQRQSFLFDLWILLLTVWKVIKRDHVSH